MLQSFMAQLLHIGGNHNSINFSNNNGTGLTNNGNFSGDPLFVDAQNNNFNLQSSSPCIGTGESGTNVICLSFLHGC